MIGPEIGRGHGTVYDQGQFPGYADFYLFLGPLGGRASSCTVCILQQRYVYEFDHRVVG